MGLRRNLHKVLMAALLTLPLSAPGFGASIETLLMPGPVSKAHAKTEQQCSACHDRTDRARQTAL